MPVKVTDLSKMTTPEKYEELCKLTPGSILQFPGQITWFTALDKTIEVWK